MDYNKLLGKKAIAKTTSGDAEGWGMIIAYCDAPTFIILRPDGTKFSWRCDLCEVLECSCWKGNDMGFFEKHVEQAIAREAQGG